MYKISNCNRFTSTYICDNILLLASFGGRRKKKIKCPKISGNPHCQPFFFAVLQIILDRFVRLAERKGLRLNFLESISIEFIYNNILLRIKDGTKSSLKRGLFLCNLPAHPGGYKWKVFSRHFSPRVGACYLWILIG